ncbi:MAG TPA: dihydrofolate reductase family protein [Leptospiraceae bacterium]|nr:dihydrofolate reductase family protein [Leptospiraceae bacterium]HMW05839.1 dihydrofolate reductase family protein [Leptospiraceae bacterium]HMX33571.1 dihydrofolate reductase family protein [Leptospiraceae bacterium]HMY34369.1 dihydrofolate reductase family protein [Leptospiraceae bacterium]HMZ64125.1 dihydrofolate reductase family protein [Leptospiraceae bacterium]
MGKLIVFNFITLNGNYKDSIGDTSWHRHGEEESEYAMENMKSDNILLFGRVTYEMMAGYWASPAAKQNSPQMAKSMNDAEKYVFSKKLKKTTWKNSKILKGNLEKEILALKQKSKKDIVILGSGSLAASCASLGLIDEYQIMIDPVLLDGAQIFKGISNKIDLRLTHSRVFQKSGVVLLCYEVIPSRIQKIKIEKDINVFYVKAKSFPEGIHDAIDTLQTLTPKSKKRRFFGISNPDKKGVIQYKACAEELKKQEGKRLGLETFRIKKGMYLSILVKDFQKDPMQIGSAFQEMLFRPEIDPKGYCLEWYQNETDVLCLVPIG